MIGLELGFVFPALPWMIGAVMVVAFTLLAAAPPVRRLVRRSPRELLAGRG
jgi:ABC-type antimicrobial peptide transport system permease subunit